VFHTLGALLASHLHRHGICDNYLLVLKMHAWRVGSQNVAFIDGRYQCEGLLYSALVAVAAASSVIPVVFWALLRFDKIPRLEKSEDTRGGARPSPAKARARHAHPGSSTSRSAESACPCRQRIHRTCAHSDECDCCCRKYAQHECHTSRRIVAWSE